LADLTRRRFLELWQAGVALIAATLLLPSIVFWWRHARGGSGGESWSDFGPAREVPEGRWLRKSFVIERRNRWRWDNSRETVYLFRQKRQFRIVSSVCPHSGCLVRQRDAGFVCLCHESFFGEEGEAVKGPAPRGLDELEWKVEKGHLKVKYQRFRSGLSEKRVV